MTRLSCSISLLTAVIAAPQAAAANPLVINTMPTVAVANEPGVAETLSAPGGGGTTTEVNVAVTTAPTPPPRPVVTSPRPTPRPPPTAQELYQEELRMQIRDDRKAGWGLLGSGLAVAGTAYLITSLSGAVAIDRADDFVDDPATIPDEGLRGTQRRSFGRALLIPGVGPALAIARSDSAVRAWGAGVAGLTQALGAGLAIVGLQRLGRARRLERLSLSAMGSSRHAQVSLQVRF